MRFREKSEPQATIPTASMADIAFLLIIFFMVTTIFAKEKGLQIVLPEPIEVKIAQKNITKVYVDANGIVRLDGEVIEEIGDLKDKIKMKIAENESLIVAMKTERECPYGRMVEVFDQLKLAEAKRISFVPSKPK
ncbi:biopolymer transporter ExbD [candidate division TA06 bacterium]|nr:biopolymer transporter ExbD [candidate division TA06 bacterium]